MTTIAGVLGGLFCVGIRRWIPATHVPKGPVFGLLVMIVPGIIVFNTDNPDLQAFERVLLFRWRWAGRGMPRRSTNKRSSSPVYGA